MTLYHQCHSRIRPITLKPGAKLSTLRSASYSLDSTFMASYRPFWRSSAMRNWHHHAKRIHPMPGGSGEAAQADRSDQSIRLRRSCHFLLMLVIVGAMCAGPAILQTRSSFVSACRFVRLSLSSSMFFIVTVEIVAHIR